MRWFIAITVACSCLTVSIAADKDDKFVPLFDGKSLDGWVGTVKPDKDSKIADWKETWSIKDGIVQCTGKPNGYIATANGYSNYTLRLKWRYPADAKAGNSGVLLYVQKDDAVWPVCIEAQLRSGRAGDIWLNFPPETKLAIDKDRFDETNKEKRHYWRIGKDDAVEKPFGEWNQYEITCVGGDITLIINGKKVNEGKNGNLTKGRIALQSEGAEVAFKDVEIKLLGK